MVTSARWGMLVGDTRKAPTTQRVVLAPNGRFCTDAVLQSIVARHVTKFDEMGYPEDWDGGDFPTFDIYATVHGDPFLEDTEGVEWLANHCRKFEVSWDIDTEAHRNPIDPWPQEMQDVCRRVCMLHDVLIQLDRIDNVAPLDFKDTTTKVVLDEVVRKRCWAEIDSLEAKIAEFRESCPRVGIPDELCEED